MDLVELSKECEEFAHAWLITLAKEHLAWSDNAVLCEGKLRELGRMCEAFCSGQGLRIASDFYRQAATRFLATGGFED